MQQKMGWRRKAGFRVLICCLRAMSFKKNLPRFLQVRGISKHFPISAHTCCSFLCAHCWHRIAPLAAMCIYCIAYGSPHSLHNIKSSFYFIFIFIFLARLLLHGLLLEGYNAELTSATTPSDQTSWVQRETASTRAAFGQTTR